MKLWIGHLLENTQEWFLVWASNEKEAICMVDAAYGEPDIRSLLAIDRPGCLSLILDRVDESEEEPQFLLALNCEEDLILERRKKPKVENWVEYCVLKPFGPAKNVDTSFLAEQMRIVQPEVLDAYNFPLCPMCKSRDYSEIRGCLKCGHHEP